MWALFYADLVAKSKCGGGNSKRVLLSEMMVGLTATFLVALGHFSQMLITPLWMYLVLFSTAG